MTHNRTNRTTKSRKKSERSEKRKPINTDIMKQLEMKEKMEKGYLRRTRKILETKLFCGNLIKEINNLAVPLVRHSGSFLKRTREELKEMNQKFKKNDHAEGFTFQR